MADDHRSDEHEAKVHAQHAAQKVEKAAKKGYVRGGPDGPEDLEGLLRRSRDTTEQTWTRGADPAAAAQALAEASVGTTGGPFADGYKGSAQADAVSEEDRIAGQHRAHAKSSKGVSEKEAKAKADEEAKAKKEAADKATKGGDEKPAKGDDTAADSKNEDAAGSEEGGAKEAADAPVGTGDTSPTPD